MRYQYILFDLDGTLTDPGIGITNSVIYALKKFGIAVGDRSELYKFIGPPLWESFERYFGFSKEQANTAVDYYREYFAEQGLFENTVYAGIPELLQTLRDKGRKLLVATSKPEQFAKRILDHFDLAQHFTLIAGSNMDGSRVIEGEVIQFALDSCGINDLSGVVMVGDREHDIFGAKACGISSIGVLFGYGDRAEHEAAGADAIVTSVEELAGELLN